MKKILFYFSRGQKSIHGLDFDQQSEMANENRKILDFRLLLKNFDYLTQKNGKNFYYLKIYMFWGF